MIIYFTKEDLEDLEKGKNTLPLKVIKEEVNHNNSDKYRLALKITNENFKKEIKRCK